MSRYSRIANNAPATRFAPTVAASAVLALALSHSATAWSAQIPISNVPLFIGQEVAPNVFFELDDSGSMGSSFLDGPDPGFALSAYQDSSGDDYYPQGVQEDWRTDSNSPLRNTLAFNGDPAERPYDPWWDTAYGNSDYDDARTWPVTSSPEYSGNTDLSSSDQTYIEWVDDAGTASDPPNGSSDYTSGGDGVADAWDTYRIVTIRANEIEVTETSFSPSGSGPNPTTSTNTYTSSDGSVAQLHGQTTDEVRQRYANWYTYYRTRNHVTVAAVGNLLRDFTGIRFGANSIWDRYFVEMPSASASAPYTSHNDSLWDTIKEEHRSSGGTPLRNGVNRAGNYYEDDLSEDSPINLECQQNFTLALTDGFWNQSHSGTGEVDGDGYGNLLGDIARYYYQTDLAPGLADEVITTAQDPLTGDTFDHQHMVTFGVAFGVTGHLEDTDADGQPDNDTTGQTSGPYEVDTQWTPDSSPSGDETLDDLWHAAYNSTGQFLSAQDPEALAQEMANALVNVTERDGSAASLAVNSGTVQSDSAFFQAQFTSGDWTGDLLRVPLEQEEQNGITQTTADASDPDWRTADVNAGLDPSNREIVTYKPSTGAGIPFQWPSNPSSPTSQELDVDQSTALSTNPDTNNTDTLGDERLAYLRGERSEETDNGGVFRDRTSIYGDFVNSAPVYVGRPAFLYPENWPSPSNESSYANFVNNKKNREELVYVGANDGMLHAFDAETGNEVFNYVPDAVFEDLNELTSTNYSHQYYVDGSPTYADAYFDGSWHSVLVGGLGKGGQGVYALDITDPGNLNEGNADDVVLWEFGDEDTSAASDPANGDPDLGVTMSQPSVVRLPNGEWAAVFGNGYNNTASDGSASSTGNAVLYIVDIETGGIIRKFDTGVGAADDPQGNDRPNGLAAPAPVDVDGDSVVDYIYAGDLFGNLWKIDVTSSDSGNWEFVGAGGGPSPKPLFTTESPNGKRQPITVRPEVGPHPNDSNAKGRIVYFGTGKYLGAPDDSQTGQVTQSFYGVWDHTDDSGNQVEFTPSDLIQQGVLDEQNVTRTSEFDGSNVSNTIRITSDKEIKWDDFDNSTSNDDGGWVFHLTEPVGLSNPDDIGDGTHANRGERVVNDAVLRDKRVIFTTTIPSDDPCDFGGKSYIMELDRRDGGRLAVSPFDLNEDTKRDSADRGQNGNKTGGILTDTGLASQPAAIMGEENEKKAMSNSSGEIQVIDNEPPDRRQGRQSWQELR